MNEERGAAALLALARNASVPHVDRLAAATRLAACGQAGAITPALASIAADRRATDEQRLAAAELLARYDRTRAADLYASVAEDATVYTRRRLAAADWVAARDRTRALRLYVRICVDGDHLEARIDAGLRAGALDPVKGVRALADVLRQGGMSHHMEWITRAAVSISGDKALHEWSSLRLSGAEAAVRRAIRGE